MVKHFHRFILLVILLFNLNCFSQKVLEIYFTSFGKIKKFEVYNGDHLEYKLKGQHGYRRDKVVNLQDSFIVFSNDTMIKLNQLKAIRIQKNNTLVKTFQRAFIILGGGFFFLNTTNNIINERSPVIDVNGALIGGGLIITGILVKQLNIKRVRLKESKHLKILDLNFNNLSEKPEK